MRTAARLTHVVLRYIASVMITSGVLMLGDAALTLTWQEPVSAFVAKREQHRLDGELEAVGALVEADRRAIGAAADPESTLKVLAARSARRARAGNAIGRLELPSIERSATMVEGTTVGTLRKGPGHDHGTPFPGQPGTFVVAGHRTTFGAPFRKLDKLRPGDKIIVRMAYGTFTYHMERTKIVSPNAVWVKRRADHDRLVLIACHPPYSAAKRIVAFARLVRAEPGQATRSGKPGRAPS